MSENLRLVLLGDSDIACWPADLHPTFPTPKKPPISSGHSGATLRDISCHLGRILEDHGNEELLFVLCAGENDIGEGLSLDNSVSVLEQLLEMILASSEKHQVIFLGPKFEPWQENDMGAKKNTAKCQDHFSGAFLDEAIQIVFIL